MKATEVTVSVKQVKNLGNYENFAVEASITVALDENEKASDVYDKAWSAVKSEVNKQILLKLNGGK